MGADTEAALPDMHSRSPGQSNRWQSLHLPVLLFMSHTAEEDLPLRCLRLQHLHLCLPLQQRCQSSNEKTAEVHATHSFAGVPCIPKNTESMMQGVSEIGQQNAQARVLSGSFDTHRCRSDS